MFVTLFQWNVSLSFTSVFVLSYICLDSVLIITVSSSSSFIVHKKCSTTVTTYMRNIEPLKCHINIYIMSKLTEYIIVFLTVHDSVEINTGNSCICSACMCSIVRISIIQSWLSLWVLCHPRLSSIIIGRCGW